MTREMIKQIERDYWAEKADPIDMVEVFDLAQRALEQEPVLDKVRAQINSNLRGVEIALEVLDKNHKLRPKMEGALDTLKECLSIIDQAESEDWEVLNDKS